jgi:hypothetical protein
MRLCRLVSILLIAMATRPTTTLAADGSPWSSFEKNTLNPGELSQATPADIGLPFERVAIPSNSRQLDGFLVRAEASCQPALALLIFHGRGETVADWIGSRSFSTASASPRSCLTIPGMGKAALRERSTI